MHFSNMEGQRPSMTLAIVGDVKLTESFNERFKDAKNRKMELNIFAVLFSVEAADVFDNLQRETIQVQSIAELKARYNNLLLLDFVNVT